MSPAEVVALITAIASAFGLVESEVLAYAKQQHPELAGDPPADGEAAIDAEIDAQIAKMKGFLS